MGAEQGSGLPAQPQLAGKTSCASALVLSVRLPVLLLLTELPFVRKTPAWQLPRD